MVDVAENLIAKSDGYIGKDPRLGEKFVEGLQTFAPPEKRLASFLCSFTAPYFSDTI